MGDGLVRDQLSVMRNDYLTDYPLLTTRHEHHSLSITVHPLRIITHHGSGITGHASRINHRLQVTEQGFTLLEVLVALALLAIAITVLIQLFSANLRTIHASEDYVKAAIKANSRLSEIINDKELSERSWSETTEDGYTIYMNVYKVLKDRTDDLNVELLEIDLTLKWMAGSREKSIDLKTMKMIPKKI